MSMWRQPNIWKSTLWQPDVKTIRAAHNFVHPPVGRANGQSREIAVTKK
jgi:hypothetical protein